VGTPEKEDVGVDENVAEPLVVLLCPSFATLLCLWTPWTTTALADDGKVWPIPSWWTNTFR
jgi:hypothetical protein